MFPLINWNLISLELLITATLVVLIIVDIIAPKKNYLGLLSFSALFGLIGFWATQSHVFGSTFGGMFVSDSLSWFFKGIFLVTMVFIFAMTQQFFKSLTQERRNEFYFLLWLALLGMCFIASSADFLLMFIAMDILTISLYVLTAYLKADKLSIEAAMKYLILGALTSGFFLFGVSLIYGVSHSTHFSVVQAFVNTHEISPMILFGMVLVFAGIGFKIAAVPFQLWVADVYQGAPTPITALLSVGSKAAGFVMLIRVFLGVFGGWHMDWSFVLACLSAATMCYGNLCALFQTNIKRLLGFSSIGHAGYLLMGAAAGSALGVAGMNYYLLGYLFTNLAAFTVIILVFMAKKSDAIEDYAGLSQRSPLLAATLLLALVSLAGLPPLVGFFGKFTLLMATVKSGYIWLALIATVNIVVSIYYYLRIAKRLYVDPAKDTSPILIYTPLKFLLIFAITGIITLGIFQGPFLEAAITATQGMFLNLI